MRADDSHDLASADRALAQLAENINDTGLYSHNHIQWD